MVHSEDFYPGVEVKEDWTEEWRIGHRLQAVMGMPSLLVLEAAPSDGAKGWQEDVGVLGAPSGTWWATIWWEALGRNRL